MPFPRKKTLIFLLLVVVMVIIYIKYDSEDDEPSEEVAENVEYLHENRLLNLKNFKFILEPNLCSNRKDPPLGVIIVTSYVGHDDVRAAHRRGVSQSELQKLGLSRVFLLAQIPSSEKFITQNSVASEQRRFNDLLQGDFVEHYRNLTYKHVMGIRWAAKKCSHAKFIIKMDDDSVHDIYRVYKYLKLHEAELKGQNFLGGYVFQHQKPIRLEADKHFVTAEEFPGDEYPKYLSGWLYLTNPQTVRLLLQATLKRNFFWIDDTYVTGMLAQDQPIEFLDLTPWFSANSDFFHCCLRDSKRSNLECEFVVGPNGGDTQLLSLFQLEARRCFESDTCTERRGIAEDIRQTCVTEYRDVLRNSHGSAIVRPIKL